MTKETTLYRAYGPDDQLLYVGITGNGPRRMRQHHRSSRWWPEATAIQLSHFPTRGEAEMAEYEAIRTENPRYNVQRFPRDLVLRTFPDDLKKRLKGVAIMRGTTLRDVVLEATGEYIARREAEARA